jgi:hypothetical protein
MDKNSYTPFNKYTQPNLTLLQQVFKAFHEKPSSMKEVFVNTGILRENICWKIGELREQRRVFILRKRKCSITGRIVNEYSCNENLRPNQSQLELF